MDVANYFLQGGWSFLDPESDVEGEADEQSEDDGAYAPSDDDEEEGSEDGSEEELNYSDASEDESDISEDGIFFISIFFYGF